MARIVEIESPGFAGARSTAQRCGVSIERAVAEVPAAQGYLAVTTERGDREYLLGPRTNTETTPPLLDWRSAPLAEAFFRAAPGEPFELETGERVTGGTVRE